MTLIEAYFLVLDEVDALKKQGFSVSETKPRHKSIPGANLKPEYWRRFSFSGLISVQIAKLVDILHRFALAGIYFDISGIGDKRDWYVDWSFECSEKECWDFINIVDDLEDKIAEK